MVMQVRHSKGIFFFLIDRSSVFMHLFIFWGKGNTDIIGKKLPIFYSIQSCSKTGIRDFSSTNTIQSVTMGLFWAYQGQQKEVHLPSGLDPALPAGRGCWHRPRRSTMRSCAIAAPSAIYSYDTSFKVAQEHPEIKKKF